ncbi:hypothetical protein B0I08_11282 [Glaciihabitans tibetensis]|uniref:Uncharacterized protein n=1 Tax=Glaciihabitans tibetensis TaxID=1266600 RepID=A0A2T0V3J9_9MICO|nr:hypothetical protein [Glaciihabitans tibetensis]PRY64697.1 hypothetical protein B0I08_11282 [Glaciihabitans tibetensis]
MTEHRELSRKLTALVSTIAGVVEVYPSEPLVRTVARDVLAAAAAAADSVAGSVDPDGSGAPDIAGAPDGSEAPHDSGAAVDDARVKVTQDSSGALVVTANIGVAGDHPVPETLRAVSHALSGYLREREPASASTGASTGANTGAGAIDVAGASSPRPVISVTVSRIDNSVMPGLLD